LEPTSEQPLGTLVGAGLGSEERGLAVGLAVGFMVGLAVGLAVGFVVGLAVGLDEVGTPVGAAPTHVVDSS